VARIRWSMSSAGCRLAAVAVAVAILIPAAGAQAAPSPWKPLGTSGQLNVSDVVGLARTADRSLHVAWFRRTPDGLYDVLQTPVAPAGGIGAPVPIVTGWASVEGPSLIAQGSALSAFFSGTQTTTTGDPHEGVDMATSGDGGASWSLVPSAVASGDFASSRDAAVVLSGSTFVQSWYAGEETVVHAGLDRSVPAQRGYGSGTDQALAADASGAVLVAWCTGVQGPNGVYVQPVDPSSGAPAGAAQLMPGSTVVVGGTPETFCPANTRVPLVAREGGGFFVASTDVKRRAVRVWRSGAASSATLAGGTAFKQQLALAGAPGGRLWAGWMEDGKLKLRRSNPAKRAKTIFGATVTVPGPAADGVYQLDLSGQADRADAIIRAQTSDAGVTLLHAQAYPGLTLTAKGGSRASFKVTDAGDAVAGATIRVGGLTATTNSAGRASVSLGRGRFKARASKDKYVAASAAVRVR
jgi:hypothetical protein